MFQKAEPREIKKLLQQHFNYPFSVRRDRGTAHHWINVSWTDGPTDEAVRAFCSKFNDKARDDYMTDLWCGCQYTSEHRHHSQEAYLWAVAEIEKELNIKIKVTLDTTWDGKPSAYIKNEDDIRLDHWPDYASRAVNRKLAETDFREMFKEEPKEIEKANGKTVRENIEKQGVEIVFDEKPSDQILIRLKANGWRWSRFNRVWYNRLTPKNLEFAKSL